MDERRIYGKKIAIDKDKVRGFYNRQAASSESKMGSVFLGNQSPEVLEQKNSYCKDYILPMLDAKDHTRVLDLGCGIGRWAEFVLPNCGCYCGVDFSEEMIRAAEQTCNSQGGSFQLHCMSVVDAAAQDAAFYGSTFDLVIISGVLMYLNDPDVERIFRCLPSLLAERCTIYSAEPIGLERRLTLNDFPSQTFHTEYSAIYRTHEEYDAFFAPLLKSGFSVAKREPMPKFGENYADTARYYTILRR